MGGSGTSSTNQIEAPTMIPMTIAWMATAIGRVKAVLEPPDRFDDSINTFSNMCLLPTSGTPALLGRFRGRRGGQGLLTQIHCLLPVPVGRGDVFLLLGRVGLDLRLLAVQEVDVGQRVEVVWLDLEGPIDRRKPHVDDLRASRGIEVGVVVGAVPSLDADHDPALRVVR